MHIFESLQKRCKFPGDLVAKQSSNMHPAIRDLYIRHCSISMGMALKVVVCIQYMAAGWTKIAHTSMLYYPFSLRWVFLQMISATPSWKLLASTSHATFQEWLSKLSNSTTAYWFRVASNKLVMLTLIWHLIENLSCRFPLADKTVPMCSYWECSDTETVSNGAYGINFTRARYDLCLGRGITQPKTHWFALLAYTLQLLHMGWIVPALLENRFLAMPRAIAMFFLHLSYFEWKTYS